ncbi:MAG: TlpA family protein disulfide reductase, partial [Coriobacteriia bacterium]
MVDGLQSEYEGTVEFKLYDVEKDEEGARLADQFGAQFVPTFVFANADGSIAQTVVGEMTEETL